MNHETLLVFTKPANTLPSSKQPPLIVYNSVLGGGPRHKQDGAYLGGENIQNIIAPCTRIGDVDLLRVNGETIKEEQRS